MNLNALDSHVMIAHSTQWLTRAEVRAPIERHALGQAMLAELQKAHSRLSQEAEKRRQYRSHLAHITDLIANTDLRHDRNARALYNGLEALIEIEDDPATRDVYLRMQSLLFPEGLRIVSRTFSHQAGAIETLKQRVTPELREQLAALMLGTKSFDNLYQAWVEAGTELGNLVAKRERLLHRAVPIDGNSDAETATPVTTIDLRAARVQWISATRTFLDTLEIIDLTADQRAAVRSPLATDIASALRGRLRSDDPASESPVGNDNLGDTLNGDSGDEPAAPPVVGDGDADAPESPPAVGDGVVDGPAAPPTLGADGPVVGDAITAEPALGGDANVTA
ncbi:MAG: hypothetical protein Tsb0020_08000 [Haliangiales bacterium]